MLIYKLLWVQEHNDYKILRYDYDSSIIQIIIDFLTFPQESWQSNDCKISLLDWKMTIQATICTNGFMQETFSELCLYSRHRQHAREEDTVCRQHNIDCDDTRGVCQPFIHLSDVQGQNLLLDLREQTRLYIFRFRI